MEKKRYQAPTVKKVRLDIKSAVLGNCHVSPVLDAQTPGIGGCRVTPNCFTTN